jgi:hypothetical protein
MVYRASSEAEAREPDLGMDVESQVSSEAEAREQDSGIGAWETDLNIEPLLAPIHQRRSPHYDPRLEVHPPPLVIVRGWGLLLDPLLDLLHPALWQPFVRWLRDLWYSQGLLEPRYDPLIR